MRLLEVKPNRVSNNCSKKCCAGGAGAVVSGMSSMDLVTALNPELVRYIHITCRIIKDCMLQFLLVQKGCLSALFVCCVINLLVLWQRSLVELLTYLQTVISST